MIAAEAAAKADSKAADPEEKAARREEATAKAGSESRGTRRTAVSPATCPRLRRRPNSRPRSAMRT
jgi:hypothetical protein